MSMLVYRPITADDYPRAARALQLAFGDGDDDGQTLRWLESGGQQGQLRGLYAGGELVCQMELLTFDIQSGRGTLAAGGFGGVATPPEHRRRGYVAALLRDACDELLERGVTVTLLDAFKESFYRRYGWAAFSERRRYTGAPELFAPMRRIAGQHGRFAPAGEAEIGELDAVYREALRGRFGPVVRTPQWWQSLLGDRRNNPFVWRDDQGRARAYTIYRLVTEGDERHLRCREMVALDPQARAQLFAFLSNHDAHVSRIQFDAPSDAPVNLLFPDPLACQARPYFMLRILDVAALLTAYRFPKGSAGRLTLAVDDDWMARNRGVYELDVDDTGAAQCRRTGDGGEADLRCDVRVLSQLVSRYVRPRTAAAFGLLEVPRREALGLAEQLFSGLAPFFSDHF